MVHDIGKKITLRYLVFLWYSDMKKNRDFHQMTWKKKKKKIVVTGVILLRSASA